MHHQITLEERYAIMALKKQRYSMRSIARELGRAPSTISREFRRNPRPSGSYTPSVAHQYAVARRRRSRRNSHFDAEDWALVRHLLERDWSPEQISGWLERHGLLRISYETIYLYIWKDKREAGISICICARPPRSAANATGLMTQEEDWLVNGTSPNVRPRSRRGPNTATGR